jgi:hypothetical protein
MAQNTPIEHDAGIPDCNFNFAQNNRSAVLSRQAQAVLAAVAWQSPRLSTIKRHCENKKGRQGSHHATL